MFKTKLLLSVALSALMLAGCTSETDDLFGRDSEKITRICVGTEEEVKTKTVTNPNTHAVTWEQGDEVALVDVSNGTYQKFVWSEYAAGDEGVTNEAAYFVAAEGEDGLTIGKSYKVIYPYSSVVNYNGVSGEISCLIGEVDYSIENLKENDWLYSDAQVIPADGTVPGYTMKHAMALVKINVEVAGIESQRQYLRNVTLRSQIAEGEDRFPLFAYYICWEGNDKDFAVETYDATSVSYIPSGWRMQNETVTFWLPVYMNSETSFETIDIIAYWSASATSSVLRSCSTKKTLKAPLAAGNLYELDMLFTLAESGTSATIHEK